MIDSKIKQIKLENQRMITCVLYSWNSLV